MDLENFLLAHRRARYCNPFRQPVEILLRIIDMQIPFHTSHKLTFAPGSPVPEVIQDYDHDKNDHGCPRPLWDYDGKNVKLKGPYCFGCSLDDCYMVYNSSYSFYHQHKERNQNKLFLCQSCQAAWYCSKTCQAAHSDVHKSLCTHMTELRLNVRASTPGKDEVMGDAMTRYYISSRYHLAVALYWNAYFFNIQNLWSELNGILENNLRLCHHHLCIGGEMSTKFPMYLIAEGRFDDAYSVCRFIIQKHTSRDDDVLLMKGSEENPWICPREKWCCLNDFFDDCLNHFVDTCCDDVDTIRDSIPIVATIWLMKKIILSMSMTKMKLFEESFPHTNMGSKLGPDICHHIATFLVLGFHNGNDEDYIYFTSIQSNQLYRLSKFLHTRNPFVFQKLLSLNQRGGHEANGCEVVAVVEGQKEMMIFSGNVHEKIEQIIAWNIANDLDYSAYSIPDFYSYIQNFLNEEES